MKTAVPLSIHKAIEPLLPTLKNGNFTIDKLSSIFKIKDSDPMSDFHFEIKSFELRDSKTLLVVRQKPTSADNLAPSEFSMWISDFNTIFPKWVNLIEEYKNTETVFDDPIIKKYEEEFFTEFDKLDQDADKAGFSYPKQLLIDKALSDIIEVLESKRDEESDEKVTLLIKEAEQIKEELTDLTQIETATRIAKLLAKIRKSGMKFIKAAYPIFQKEIVTQLVKGLIDSASHAQAHIHTIAETIQSLP